MMMIDMDGFSARSDPSLKSHEMNIKVLSVDDSPFNLMMAKKLLGSLLKNEPSFKNLTFDVVEAVNG